MLSLPSASPVSSRLKAGLNQARLAESGDPSEAAFESCDDILYFSTCGPVA
jgi:hypothetical protein